MKLELKPCTNNAYPIYGLLIEGKNIHYWLQQMQRLQINLDTTSVYALPGATPNSIWGCFVAISIKQINAQQLERLTLCQCVFNKLYIPLYAQLTPTINDSEIEKLFPEHKYILHPEIGLFTLDTPVDFSSILEFKQKSNLNLKSPIESSHIPKYIRNMQIESLPPEESLNQLEENSFPKQKKFNDKPLNWKEKIKLNLLRKFFNEQKSNQENKNSSKEKTRLLKLLDKILPGKQISENLEQDLEELERRNSSEMQKLMDMFKRDPDEALKYAIPLDNNGLNRGGNHGAFNVSMRWSNFNLFGNNSAGSGNSLLADDSYYQLQQQYNKTAQDLIAAKKYDKAAFVYLKLLKNNHLAAHTLEEGKLYGEAASVYIKYLENKNKAAECYEKGYMTSQAIELYKELNQKEKVGDLYSLMNQKKEAFHYYNEVVEEYKADDKIVKASLLLKQKMENTSEAQKLLLHGWRNHKDAFNCINNYFTNIEDQQTRHQSIESIYSNETDNKNKLNFLKALSLERKKDKSLHDKAKNIAYEIVAELAESQPNIVLELTQFNEDKSLNKDLIRYKSDAHKKSKINIA